MFEYLKCNAIEIKTAEILVKNSQEHECFKITKQNLVQQDIVK